MSRKKSKTPSYLLHRPTGQARVRLKVNGRPRDFYLGPFGSPESWERYHRLLAEHLQDCGKSGSTPLTPQSDGECLSIAELVLMYDDFSREYYVKDGEITNDRFRAGVGALLTLYGSTPIWEFGPNRLRSVREYIILRGNANNAKFDDDGNLEEAGSPLSRKYVNCLIRDMLRMFKWAVSRELVSVTVYDTLAKVEGIRKGKDVRLRETAPVRPVPDEHFWPVVKAAFPQIATMLQVQRLAGMRPDEVTIMRPCDIEQAGDLWVYRPDSHKLDWRGIDKEILLGPQAQSLLQPWTDRAQSTFLFSPKEVAKASLEKRRKPDDPNHPKRQRKRRKSGGRSRKPREHYTDDTYRRSVQRICQQVGVPLWSPGRLRHNAGTKVRHTFGVEAAQLVLGHRKLSTTEIYAEKNREEYGRIMMEIG